MSIIFLEKVVLRCSIISSHRETESRCYDTINKALELVAKDVVGILSVNTNFSVKNNSHQCCKTATLLDFGFQWKDKLASDAPTEP